MFPFTPFPATMDFSTGSSYYWNPSTYYWDPNPFQTTPYFPNEAPHWNAPPFYPPIPTIPDYLYSYPTTGYHIDPYASLNQVSYDSYVNYFTPNYIYSNYTPFYDQAQFPGTMPIPSIPMPTAAPTVSSPPAPLPMPAAPSTPTAPAVQVKKRSMVLPVNVKEEPVEDVSRICSNCKTTNASEWKSAVSKDNILCKTCFDYRRTHKENRPTLKTHVKKEMKTIKTE